jgi:hypothetical protein
MHLQATFSVLGWLSPYAHPPDIRYRYHLRPILGQALSAPIRNRKPALVYNWCIGAFDHQRGR